MFRRRGGNDKEDMFMWKSRKEFVWAQAQLAVILVIANIGNKWPTSYHRNENHDPRMFWIMNGLFGLAALVSLRHDANSSSRGIQLLSRAQTEEWKGWMQTAFILYHYYRMYAVYNEIRIFVSSYVWMTGFGNFLYFDKKQDFTLERAVSMWLRINYFPVMLSLCLGVPLELYYVVPLHTTGFFITMATCKVASWFKERQLSDCKSNVAAVCLCLVVHVVFYETPLVNSLKLFSDEYHFRFQADKYTAWVGILSGLCWSQLKKFMNWAHGGEGTKTPDQLAAVWGQRLGGVALLALWYYAFGYMKDKYMYNPTHPYVFWMPVAGWLMIRNSSKYLTELHSTVLEFFGRITLETYVLQFHLFMCNNVQHIPVVIPGSDENGPLWIKTANMLLCGVIFVSTAVWARKVTITTQTSVVELVTELRKSRTADEDNDDKPTLDERASFLETNTEVKKNNGGSELEVVGNGESSEITPIKEMV